MNRAAFEFLYSVDDFPWPPGRDGQKIAELLHPFAQAAEQWEPQAQERARWITHALERLHRGATEYGDSSFARPVAELLDEIGEEAADLGAWSFIAHQALETHDDLELIEEALRDAAAAGAYAWARIDQARTLLVSIEERSEQ